MSDLFSMLRTATRALDAQRYALDVTGQNIANVNTPGYARRTTTMAEVAPQDPWSAGGGVDVQGVTAARAPLIEARIRGELPASSRERTIATQIGILEAQLGAPGASIDAALGRFYDTYATLAQTPTSATARQQVINEGQSLSQSFGALSQQLEAARRSADAEIRDVAQQINILATRVADLNAAIVDSRQVSPDYLKDEQANAINALAELIDVHAIPNADGTTDLAIGNGRALVSGARAFPLTATSQAPDGLAALTTTGTDITTDVTSEIAGGKLAGLLQVRDVLIGSYQSRLDELAYGVTTDVNALARSGYDVTGAAGVDFFQAPATVAGAARTMSVNGAVAADGRLVVAAGAASPGDNTIARAVSNLREQPMTGGNGNSPVSHWSQLVYAVGSDGRRAQQSAETHDQVLQQLKTLRDQISGVSLDEEAANLMRFQRAYEANARFFQVAEDTLAVLMNLVRV